MPRATPSAHRRRVVGSAILVVAAAGGCFWPFRRGEPKPPTVQLRFAGVVPLNPDTAGTSHSVVVTVYQLTERTKFESVQASTLLRDDARALGAELVDKQQIVLEPASQQTMTVTLAKPTRFLGATADFFIRDGSAWRQVWPVKSGTKQVRIDVRGRQLVIR